MDKHAVMKKLSRCAFAAASLLAASCVHEGDRSPEFLNAAQQINQTIRENHYHPDELDSTAYRAIEAEVLRLGKSAATADEFLTGFNAIWRNGPFSHVALRRADQPAAVRIAKLDTMIAGPDAATLTWQENAAILTVNTMTGADTIEAINAAYEEIVSRGAGKVIIDLRGNTGGTFAVVPLVGHLIAEPVDAGVFVTGRWYDDHDEPPGPDDFPSATPWRGYSVKAFQADVLTRALTSYRIDPMQPLYGGPVIVLIGPRTISAGEIAADVLKATGRATIIGEKTPGIVLSSKLFDVSGGIHLRVPIADYFSIENGRIEGAGVTPDLKINAERALDAAIAH